VEEIRVPGENTYLLQQVTDETLSYKLVSSTPYYRLEIELVDNLHTITADSVTYIHYQHVWKSIAYPEDLYKIGCNIIKLAHAVTSIKQSPVLKGHLFLILS